MKMALKERADLFRTLNAKLKAHNIETGLFKPN